MDELWLTAPAPALRLRRGGTHPVVQANAAALDWAAAIGLAASALQAVELPPAAAGGGRVDVRLGGRGCAAHAVPLPDGMLLWLLPAGAVGGMALERALSQAGLSVWRVDMASRRVHLNAIGFRRLGLEPDPAGVPLSQVRATIHPEDRDGIAAGAELALAGDGVVDVRARYRNPDGSWRLVLTRRVAERDAAGRALGLLGVSLDLNEEETQRQRADTLAQRTHLVAEAIGVGFWQREPDQGFLTWDEQMYRIHGRDPAHGPPADLEWAQACVHPDDRAWVQDCAARADAAWAPTSDLLYRAAQADALGGERWIQSWARRLVRDGRRVALGMHMDVTDRVREQAARQRERERVQFAIDTAQIGVWERDAAGRLVYWNDVMYRLRGLAPTDPRAPEAAAAETTHPEDRPGLLAAVRRQVEEREPYRLEYRVCRPDGAVRWILTQGHPIRDAAGRVSGMVGINIDITERREAEALQREKQLLERTSREKSALMARLSHGLRTPLNAVLGFTRLMEDDVLEPPGPRQRERLARIGQASQRLRALVDEALEVATLQAQAEAQPAAAEVLPVPGLLSDVAAALANEAERCGVRLRWPAAGRQRALAVLADRQRAVQGVGHVLLQLLRRCPRGGLLQVHAELLAAQVHLQVEMHGPKRRRNGEQPTLFGDLDLPSAAPARHPAADGFVPASPEDLPMADELALVLARSLLHPIGGEVQWSARGDEPAEAGEDGVLMRCLLRLPAAAPAAPADAGAGGEPRTRPFHVVCVEDNPVNLQLVCEVLALRPQVALRTAVDGSEGLRAARADPAPDLVLLDLQLPDMHGVEVLRRLRQDPRLAATVIVALSADAMAEHVRAALDAGFDAYWTKPIHFDRFLADIDRLMAARAGRA